MLKAWNWFILLAATFNAVFVAVAWYNGEPAWWFVWLSSIVFSVDVGLVCIRDLMEAV